MIYIDYELCNTGSLETMAPTALENGEFSDATLPMNMREEPGIYIIVNGNEDANRYVGITSNLVNRFKTRLATVTELGFSSEMMNNIYVAWGSVKVFEEVDDGYESDSDATDELMDDEDGFPSGEDDGWKVINPVAKKPLVVEAGNQTINLEHLLIRFVRLALGAGGTVSNNVYSNTAFVNTSGKTIKMRFRSSAFGNFDAYKQITELAANEAW